MIIIIMFINQKKMSNYDNRGIKGTSRSIKQIKTR